MNNGKLIESKKLILAFAEIYGKLPSRNSADNVEVSLAQKMENYLSPKSGTFDPNFRSYIFEKFPRKTNYKRTHNKEERILELKRFMTRTGRLPRTRSYTLPVTREERLARSILDNYAAPSSPLFDESVYQFVKSIDPQYGNTGLSIDKRG